MASIAQFPAPNAPGHLTKVPIAELSPDLEQTADKSILAAVTLVWPYSSAHKSLSLLLAEPDFRLRGSKGQVKATFHGRVAEKVAESHIGIGDSICLGLNGSKFVRNETSQQSPGRSIAWDVHFETGVCLELHRPPQAPLTINVEHATSPTVSQEAGLEPPTTPTGKLIGIEHGTGASTGSWQSPVFLKPSRLSFGGINRRATTTFDPFAEDDGFVPGKGRKKPRYSLQRDDWRLVDEPDSPHEQEKVLDWDQVLDQELDEAGSDTGSTDEHMPDTAEVSEPEKDVGIQEPPPPVFAKPSLELTGSILERRAEELNSSFFKDINQTHVHLPTDTPKIRPIPSPGLPVPSPLVSDHTGLNDYFPSWTSSEAQEIGSVGTEIETPSASFVETNELYTPPNDLHPLQPTGLDSASEDTNIFDADFPSRNEPEPNLGSHDLSYGQQDNAVDPFFSSVDGQGFTNTGIQVDHSNEEVPDQAEDLHKEKNDAFEPIHHELYAQTDCTPEPNDQATNEAPLTDAQSLEEENASFHEQNVDRDMESAERDDEYDTKEHSQSDLEPSQDANSTADIDMDALYALESMRGLRQMEDLNKQTSPQENLESGDEIDDSSQATGILGRSRDESPYPEDDQMVDGEDRYDDQSADDYESQDDYDEEALQPEQDENSFDESEGDESEEEGGFSPRPRPTQSQEVIVLDSDSDDEPAAEPPRRLPSESSEEVDRSSSRAGSVDSAAIPDGANLVPNGIEEEEDEDEDEEEEEEEKDSWDMNSEQDHFAASDDELEDDEDQEVGDDRRSYDEADALVHDSDKDDESSVQRSFDQGENENMETSAPVLNTDDDQGHLIADPESPTESRSLDAQTSNSEELALDDDPQALDDDYHSLPDTDRNIDQELTASTSQDREDDKEQDHDDKSYHVDGAAESHFSLTAFDGVNSLTEQVSTLPVPETLDSPSIVEPQFELVPDSVQETVTLENHNLDTELDITSTVTKQASTDLDLTSQVPPPSGSIELSRDDIPQPEDHVNQDSGDEDDAVSAMEFAETIENPEPGLAVPEVVISNGPSETPLVVVQPPVPDSDVDGSRSQFSNFPNLAALGNHQDALVDTISIVHSFSPISRSKLGAKDWSMSIEITDPSIAGMTLNAQIFSRYKSAMPSLTEGSAILLCDFKPHTPENIILLVSVESSTWAVFDGSDSDNEIDGCGPEERAYASGLRRWYTEVGSASVADYILQASIERESIDRELSPPNSEVPSELGSPSSRRGSRRRRSNQRVTIHELRDGTRYTEIGSPNNRSSSVHELRDGTLYANI
ncbi:unnamed protein product [Penicillium bialowiezense]